MNITKSPQFCCCWTYVRFLYSTGSISDTARGVKSTNRPRGTSSWSPKGFVQGFTGARCGTGAWQIGATQDISNTGCFTFKPLSQCGADYDVARVDADHFSNGARDADLCTPAGRPTRLADFRSIASRREPGRHQQRPVLLRDDSELTANGVDSQTSGRKQPRGQGARFDPIRLRQTGGDRHREGREREHLDARRDENAASDSVAAARKPWRDEFVVSPLFMNRLRPERPRAL